MEEKITSINDLKFGDILIQRKGDRYVFASGQMYGESDDYYNDCDCVDDYYQKNFNYDDDMPERDIIKVIRNEKTIYEKVIKEMTLKQICDELGYEVKIIKDGDDD